MLQLSVVHVVYVPEDRVHCVFTASQDPDTVLKQEKLSAAVAPFFVYTHLVHVSAVAPKFVMVQTGVELPTVET